MLYDEKERAITQTRGVMNSSFRISTRGDKINSSKCSTQRLYFGVSFSVEIIFHENDIMRLTVTDDCC